MYLRAYERYGERKRIDRIRYREIRYPSRDEHRTPEIEVRIEKPVEGDEDRELYEHRKTRTHRIDLLLLIQLRHGRILGLRIIGIPLLDLIDLRRERSHLGRRIHAPLRKRLQKKLDEYRQQDDGHTVVRYQAIEELKKPVEDILKPRKPASIEYLVEVMAFDASSTVA